jgi:hypothetical protein
MIMKTVNKEHIVRKVYLLLALTLALGLPMAAFADGDTDMTTTLTPLNSSEASGIATVHVRGDQVTVTIQSRGHSPNLPHAQHIHIGGQNRCPTNAADMNGDGLISTPEGQPSYGPIKVSLTTEGDVTMQSGLAVDRMPMADADGNLTYTRTFQLPDGVSAADIAKGVIVQHGISELFDDPNQYDGAKKSDIPGTETLPLEATIPATCGKLMMANAMMPDTGAGDLPLALLAMPLVLLAAGLVARRSAVRGRP